MGNRARICLDTPIALLEEHKVFIFLVFSHFSQREKWEKMAK
jgi:hypothetical protein